jgi:glycosyltransferase involved in cell wall biosynthesis
LENDKKKYTGRDIAFIIPTKDRPQKLQNLLDSLAIQDETCGRIIIVDGGKSVRDVVMGFSDRIPVEYHACQPPGQIRQRNLGISLLDNTTPLVGSLDDDIILESGSLKEMVAFWNRCEPDTAGVSFNIINNPPYRYSWAAALIGMSSKIQGRVISSGYNVATTPVDQDLKTQWLSGGATIWKQEILKNFAHKEINSRWAICEDVIFSYPIGKIFPLYVCANAAVRHEHVYDHTAKMKFKYYGRTITLWRFYFVESHTELSRAYYFWMVLGQIIIRFFQGIFTFKLSPIQYAIGQIEGAGMILKSLLRGLNAISLLNEENIKDVQ